MKYLLGQAGAEESSLLEERLITDKEFYDELTFAEDELIDQYLDGHLTDLERDRFEHHFLFGPERHRKVRFGRALKKWVGANPDDEQPVSTSEERSAPRTFLPGFFSQRNATLAYSLLALLLCVGVGSWLIWSSLRNRDVRPAGNVVTLTLSPGVTRGEERQNKISIPPDTETVQLRLALASPQESYRIRVSNAEGTEVWSGDGVSQNDSFVLANVPAQRLPIGDYKVILSRKLSDGSLEEMLSYSFSIVP